METIYDWVTLALFSGLVVLFLQRAVAPDRQQDDSLILYLAAGVGCAVANYFGNHGYDLIAVLVILGTVAFAIYFLKPFPGWPRP